MSSGKGQLYKRCGCSVPVLDEQGQPVRDSRGRAKRKQAGANCPKLKRKDGSWNPRHGTWTFSVAAQGKGGKRTQVVRSGFESYDDAQAALDKLKQRAAAGVVVTDRITVGRYLAEWIEQKSPELRAATLRSYQGHIERILTPELGHLQLDALRVEHVGPVLSAVPGSDATRQRVRATLRSALTDAQRQGLVTVNVASLVKLPSGRRPKALVWTHEREQQWRDQVAEHVAAGKSAGKARELVERPSAVMCWRPDQLGAFLDAAGGDRLYALWHLIAHRGLRRGEAAALRWDDVDLAGGTVTVRRQLVVVDWKVSETPPKSEAGERAVALDPGTLAALKAHRKRQAAERLEWGPAWAGAVNRVFTREDGSDLHPASVSDRFAELVSAADLPPVRLHDLRHGAASLMLAAGVDMKVVQETLGHSQLAITADTYTSVYPTVAAEAAAAAAALVPRSSGTALDTSSTHAAEG
ncbi:site-specific integrase [Saccharopolyspora cebuensis]|uniref:Tyrosine-type recombinase/integrase n=1 Tax=Saccharopolyspora cebuensis TaxID=418759 RepID=A0ABV4CEZ5_9PSEU